MEHIEAAVVGGGRAGLAVSDELAQARVEHVVLERGRVGQAWRDRWDSFCLVTPNRGVRLPGRPYDGDDPDGYMPRDAIVASLARYVDSFAAPVREGVEVLSLGSTPGARGLGLAGFGAVIFAGGFRPAYRAWLPWADAFDDLGFPIQHDGASTVVDGLYFMGVHFLPKRKSSLLFGVGEDATIVAGAIAERTRSKGRTPRRTGRP